MPQRRDLTLLSYNGLVFGAKDFVRQHVAMEWCKSTSPPYSPEQNGMIESFFRRLKEECVWLQRFRSRDAAFAVISDWIDFYNQQETRSFSARVCRFTSISAAIAISGLTCLKSRRTLQWTPPSRIIKKVDRRTRQGATFCG